MNKKIPFFNYPSVYSKDKDKYLKIFDDVCSRGAFILQNELSNFECALAEFVDSRYVLGVANATDALQLLLVASNLEPGSEVIVSAHTMVATASAIKFAGLIPVPVDIGADGLIDPNKIQEAITSKTKAIMPTQLNGRVCAMNHILDIAKQYDLLIFEDSAQALGSKYDGKAAGNFGVGGCISFYPAKTLGCFGDGGAVICNDESIYQKIKALRDHGRDENGEIKYWGYNSRLDNLQAAFLHNDLLQYEKFISFRRAIASIYFENLHDCANLNLPPDMSIKINYDIFQNFEIQADNRDELRVYLSSCGIGTLIQWGGKLLHQHPALNLKFDLPYANYFSKRYLMLPMNTSMTFDDAEYVSSCIRKFYGK
jgi:dTDP-4-amino-4,6-dideoxygalactose transaminase